MLKVDFRYADEMSQWEWRNQSCVVDCLSDCIEIYGLGVDCEYEILNVEEVE